MSFGGAAVPGTGGVARFFAVFVATFFFVFFAVFLVFLAAFFVAVRLCDRPVFFFTDLRVVFATI